MFGAMARTLTSDLLDPTSSSAGEFGGSVVALRINVDFSDAGLLPATVLTMLLLPAFYQLFDRWFGAGWRARHPESPETR